jgi:FAD synthase/SHS2 domain-containing protein
MQIFHGLRDAPLPAESALTIGVFDGVHRGHQALIATARERAREAQRLCGIMTFDPHPVEVLAPNTRIGYLSDLDERVRQFEAFGADYCCIIHFTTQTAATSARDFVRPLLETLRMRSLVIGHDFTLGYKRQGNAAFLRDLGAEWGFSLDVVEPLRADGDIISSTRIRKLVAAGEVEAAARLLGHPLAVHGTLSSQLQMQAAARLLLPPDGRYACTVGPVYASEPPQSALLLLQGRHIQTEDAAELQTLAGSAVRMELLGRHPLPPYEEVEHTADVALRVRGSDLQELLLNAAKGMSALMAEPNAQPMSNKCEVTALGDDPESLLVNWLNEILFQTEMTGQVFHDFQIRLEPGYALHATLRGSQPAEFLKQIKAVTFHNLQIEQHNGKYETLIVFDI